MLVSQYISFCRLYRGIDFRLKSQLGVTMIFLSEGFVCVIYG